MAILTNANCESLTGWTLTRGASTTTSEMQDPHVTTDTNWFISGSASIRFLMGCGNPDNGDYVGIKQNITLPTSYKLSFQLIRSDSDPTMQVLWNGSVVWTVSGTYSYHGSGDLWDCDDSHYDSRTLGNYYYYNAVDLSAYAGQTADLEFRFYTSSDWTYHRYNDGYAIDYITESYGAPVGDYYVVASGGSDSNAGTSWATAWATVDKGVNSTPSGKTLHIGFGTYSSEPADNDILPATAIEVVYETATTGGGTGTANIEVNT